MEYLPEICWLYIILYVLVFLFGSVIGSFLNVLIYRLPQNKSFTKGRSFCPDCRQQLKAIDLVPLFSYLFLRGKCRYCQAKISPRYPLVEALGGILAVVSLAVYGLSLTSIASFALIAGLIAISFIDWDTLEIPNGLVIYLFIPALALVFLLPDVSLLSHGIGFFAVSLPLFILANIIKGSFGGGDIKMMAACGLALGWQLSLVALFIAFIGGGIHALYMLRSRKGGAKTQFAFGPYLALGVTASLLFGSHILSWYMGFFVH